MLCFVFAALVVLLDQFLKHWVILSIEPWGHMDLIPGIIGLTNVPNSGAAFSLLSGQRWLLAGISLVATIILIFILLRYTEGFWGSLGLAAVLGGTVGNLIDRVLQGHVTDMFETEFMEFAIFNVADAFLTLGFITFCVHFIVSSVKTAKREKQLAQGEEEEDTDEEGAVLVDEAADDPYSMYDVPDKQEIPSFEDFPFPDKTVSMGEEAEFTVQAEYFEPDPGGQGFDQPGPAPADEISSALDDLAALESALDSFGDFDADELLRTYGFEDDGNDEA